MMQPACRWVLLLVSVFIAGCGGSSSGPVSPTPSAQAGPPIVMSYSGVIGVAVNGGRSGSFKLTTTVPTTVSGGVTQPAASGTVTGSVSTIDGTAATLTGTVTTAGSRINASGGGYSIEVTADTDGTLSGTGTFNAGGATRYMPLALTPGTSSVMVNGFLATAAATAQAFCGTYSGTYFNPFKAEAELGWIAFVMNAAPYVTNAYRINGSAPASGQHTGPDVFGFTGTATLSTGSTPNNISDGILSAVVPNSSASLSGNWVGGRWIGLYSNVDGAGYQSRGTWSASPC